MSNDNIVVNMRVEFESTPIRHVAIQCPYCSRWFHGLDVTQPGVWLSYDYELRTNTFTCPVCQKDFGFASSSSPWGPKTEYNIQEVEDAEECYKDCVTKKVSWE